MKTCTKIDSLSLNIQMNQRDFGECVDQISNELKGITELRLAVAEKVKNTSKLLRTSKKLFNKNNSKIGSLLRRLHKAEYSCQKNMELLDYEKTLRTQMENEVRLLEENTESLENQFTQTQLENEELSEQICSITKRLDFTQEAKINEMQEKCDKYERVATILGGDFKHEMKYFRDTIDEVRDIIAHDSDKEGSCVICKSQNSTCVVIPCGHQCMCTKCSEDFENQRCPICQTQIKSLNRVYIV